MYVFIPFLALGQWNEISKLTASDGGSNDLFGQAVSIDADYAAIGASNENAVYIFTKTAGIWSETTKLSPSDATSGQLFGYSVSLSGDYLLVGAPGDNTFQGAAYVFERGILGWTEVAKLVAWDSPEVTDLFGWSVSIDGNLLAIAAPNRDNLRTSSGNNAGAAYIFERLSGTWTQDVVLYANDLNDSDEFAWSLSLSGNRLLVGSRKHDITPSNDEGAAYIFEKNIPGWTQVSKLIASDAANGHRFGEAVAIDGNYALVGAPEKDKIGSAYIFELSGSTWGETAILNASDRALGDSFAFSVSLSANYALIGAYTKNSSRGAAYIFKREASGNWTEINKLTASDAQNGDNFGYSVSLNNTQILVGATNEDELASNAGAVYLFNENAPLPVSLVSFEAKRETPEKVALYWRTASEHQNAGFEVEQSPDGLNFEKIAFVEGAGNSSELNNYQLLVNNSKSAYYRLRQVDFDGSFAYSPIRFVEGAELALKIRVYPNPTFGKIRLNFEGLEDPSAYLRASLYQSDGRELLRLESNTHDISEALSRIITQSAAGLYILKVQVQGKVYQQRIIKR